MKNFFIWTATFAMLLSVAACENADETKGKEVAVTGVTLNQDTATLEVGNTLTLTAIVLPENAANKVVVWSSSNTAVAALTGSTVTAVEAGTATITATTQDGNKRDSCTVKVNLSADCQRCNIWVVNSVVPDTFHSSVFVEDVFCGDNLENIKGRNGTNVIAQDAVSSKGGKYSVLCK